MIRGSRNGTSRRRGIALGIDLFIEEGAYTTLSSAVAILMALTLLFSSVTAAWTMSRSGDVQLGADSAALAGANVVGSYYTAATVIDASIATMGFAGMVITGAGMVGTLVPGLSAASSSVVDAGVRLLKARNRFASSASEGLQKLEASLPYLVAANAARIVQGQETDSVTYTGVALAVPRESASEFPAIVEDQVDTDAIEETADELDRAAQELARAAEETSAAKEAAWLADCGKDGYNMQERAGALSGISAAENPDYASSVTWEPVVGLERARAYYRWRAANEAPAGSGTEEQADSAARRAFYEFALKELEGAEIAERDGVLVCTVPLLPKNTDEVKRTELYTDARWPTTEEPGGRTLHYGTGCPGATGAPGAPASFADIEDGSVRECESCRFDVGDMGKTPAASTAIDNGFEYHLRAFTEALDEYAACRNKELELERKARTEAEDAGDTFESALAKLAGRRPRIAPPGRYGCVSCVVAGEVTSTEDLSSSFAPSVTVGRRGAISAATLAPDAATSENNVLSSFFSTLESRVGSDGAAGFIGSVMDVWGSLLVAYGNLGEGLADMTDQLIGDLDAVGAGPIARWLRDRLIGVINGLGLEPVDLTLRKPVLTDSGNVLAHADVPALVDMQDTLRSVPLGTTDPAALMQAVGYSVGEYIASMEFTVAEIGLPGGGSIPLTIRLGDIARIGGG